MTDPYTFLGGPPGVALVLFGALIFCYLFSRTAYRRDWYVALAVLWAVMIVLGYLLLVTVVGSLG